MVFQFTYFNSKALGEPIRMLLSYGNIEFEDKRVDFQKEWPKMLKDAFPLGQLPILEVDGKTMHQHIPVCRFLARKVGLAGRNEFEDYEIDSAVETVNDLRAKIATIHYEIDAKVQEEKRKTLDAETIPFYLDKLEAVAKENDGHLALKRTTWADVYFAGVSDYLNFMAKKDLTEKHPNLRNVIDKVLIIESIKNWVDKRPKTIS